ncbi:venom peptide HsVx1 [Nomia melanderi]|uniref:venom peptide HsVx1 n=1 Tax=Nomia melanderi TaxID=2448451 RepID=UPI00130469C0|nr:venom peptide HsVx1 [Nomia melanderi]
MRNIIFCTVLVAMCLVLREAHANCNFMGQDLKAGEKYTKDCNQYTCNSDGSVSGLACAEYRCAEGKETGYREMDAGKPYPECCPGPICAD